MTEIQESTRRFPLGGRLAAVTAAVVAALVAAVPAVAGRNPAAASDSNKPTTTPASHATTGTNSDNANKPPATPKPRQGRSANGTAHGIVQSVQGTDVVVTQLDGTQVTITIGSTTRVFVDGLHATVAQVKPGFVVATSWTRGRTRVLQAFDPSTAGVATVGTVRSLSTRLVVVAENDGSAVTIKIGPKTRLFLDGGAATLAAIRAGDTVVFSAAGAKAGKPAAQLRFLRPV